jgi:hypothetical protein
MPEGVTYVSTIELTIGVIIATANPETGLAAISGSLCMLFSIITPSCALRSDWRAG